MVGGERDVLILYLVRRRALGLVAPSWRRFLLSLVEWLEWGILGVVRQSRSVLLHIMGFDMGLIWRSNFEGPDVGALEESNNPFGTVHILWQRRFRTTHLNWPPLSLAKRRCGSSVCTKLEDECQRESPGSETIKLRCGWLMISHSLVHGVYPDQVGTRLMRVSLPNQALEG